MMTTGIDWLYQIEKYEDFANGPFEELWDYMSTQIQTCSCPY
jgi:hypothetical protein